MRTNHENGAIVVEATISLTVFVFLIFTLLSIVNICRLQAKMGVALNTAAKEISQYSYLYFKTGAAGALSGVQSGSSEYLQLGKDTIDGVETFMDSMSDAQGSFDSGDLEGMIGSIGEGAQAGSDVINMYADRIADDPMGFIVGMGKFAVSQGIDTVKSIIGQALAKAFMKKNLVAYKGDDPDRFLKKSGVVDGLDGLDFRGTVIFVGDNQDEIIITVNYEVQIIKLLDIDFSFKFTQMARTKAWGGGISNSNSSAIGNNRLNDNYVQCSIVYYMNSDKMTLSNPGLYDDVQLTIWTGRRGGGLRV